MLRKQNLCPGSKNGFDLKAKIFSYFRAAKFVSATLFPARLNWETFASSTMFLQQCFLNV